MPRTKEQNDLIKDKRRAKLLSAALRVFATKGYRETSVDDITAEARCSHGLFYHYFPSKPAIFAAVLEEIVLPSPGLAPFKEAQAVGGYEGLEIIASYVDSLLIPAKHEENKDYKQYLYVALAANRFFDPDTVHLLPKEILTNYNPREAFTTLIKEGQAQGKIIYGDPEEIADIIAYVLQRELENILFSKKAMKGISKEIFLSLISKK